ncbi:MAG: hypothetical protein HKM89_15320 [Gemmatimonadales bacterium]|nr:hypothetical protein [Gemmatimonadales bacterium]
MKEEQLDQLIREVGAEYNPPPPTPRDEMWNQIRAERERRRSTPPPRGGMPPWQWVAGIAAVLAIGVAIGRFTASPDGEDSPPIVVAGPSPVESTPVANVAYRLATSEHFESVETFLTTFQVDAKEGMMAEGDWTVPAQSLLLQTRLLQASPAGEDPGLKVLLDDIELVLAQIAQYSADRAEDLEFIDNGIEQRGVLVKLRAAVPAGA